MSLISGTSETDRVLLLIEPALTAMGYEIVLVRILTHPRRVLQITVDRADGGVVTVDDCAEVSRTASALLDVDDVVRGAYDLEISSPGIDRPLTRPKDFERYAGQVARLEVNPAVDGRKRFRGNLCGMSGDEVKIEVDAAEFLIPFGRIEKAKLVLTDELLAASSVVES